MPYPMLQLLRLRIPADRTARKLFTLAVLLIGAAPARAAEPGLVLSSGHSRIAQLRAGDSLSAELDGRQPAATYHFVLRDDKGTPIAHHTAKADAAGRAAARPLWAHSGVVGCDPCAGPGSKPYRFRSYREAEAALDGRQLEVTVLDAAGAVLTRRWVRVFASREERAFFSDADACPRFQFFPREPVYLSFHHLAPEAAERRFFLVADRAEGLALGEDFEDVRDPSYPRLLELAGAGPSATFEVWIPGSHDLGLYSGVVRRAPAITPQLLGSDALLGAGDDRSAAGLSITVDSTGCPPGPG